MKYGTPILLLVLQIFTLSTEILAQPSTEGLVGYWRFEETSGTIAYDSSPNGFYATLINQPARVKGKLGAALSFDGADDYLLLAQNPKLELTGAFSVTAWVKLTSSSAQSVFLSKGVGQFFASGSSIPTQAGPLGFQSGSASSTIRSITSLNDREWTHVVITKSGTTSGDTRLYLNGIQDDNRASVLNYSSERPLVIGALLSSTDQPLYVLRGMIDEVRLYNRALSSDEVSSIYGYEHTRESDITGPQLSAIEMRFVGDRKAQISWHTDELSDAQLEYGETNSYGMLSDPVTARAAFHTITIAGLTPGTAYHYRIRGSDAFGNLSLSDDRVFSTSSSLPPATGAAGKNYFMSLNGSDSNPGTLEAPLLTLRKATSLLKAGDTLFLREGVYDEALLNTLLQGESWSRPITIRAYPGERPTLQPRGEVGGVVNLATSSYLILDGLILDAQFESSYNHDLPVVKVTSNAHHIRFVNCEVKNAQNSHGFLLTGPQGDHVEIINCDIHDNGQMKDGSENHGLYISSVTNLIENSRVYNNASWGFHLFSGRSDGTVIRNNRIWANQGGVLLSNGLDVSIFNNSIMKNQGSGIEMRGYLALSGTKLFHNSIVNNAGAGIFLGVDGAQALSGTEVKNNLVYVTDPAISTDSGIRVSSTCRDTQVTNNFVSIFNIGVQSAAIVNSGVSSTVAANTVSRGLLDPLLFDSIAFFAPKQGSPLIDRGSDLGIANDASGAPRPRGAAADIGAFEYQPVVPTPPKNLKVASTRAS